VSRVERTNGDIHIIIRELESYVCATNGEIIQTTEIKKIMKEESLKPLFLMRDE
jgi:hypothetical protein